ncbi:Asp-tRNA(Asn)/Glu-tRNA(Gln) amidotransferase subunit GatA [Brumimicrobium mesophilum]|uniref:Asp-tRNA(Asn)/Glu-tRNA(Gln) amidotransferase subunit GatA n=1 Tax=Brumimicrobium mesophilum TaxID=392717 RepID=UPI000D14478C|nr:Asp-tRNA(Asn)/Glu-tRNA(Gln) amidotransferase subunit GatA [Brumimicrobium mesophilum]
MYKTFTDIKSALEKGRTVQDILQCYLNNIEERKDLNAFLEVFETSAKEQALAVDEKIKNGTAGRLAGMVIGIKDNLCYKGHKVSAASKILEGFESIYTATAVERLLAEDAVIIGRLNCDEFAMGSSNENSAYGVVRNALNEDYVPGGSSGGSASAVAGDLCTVALGSDTGGSIRQPASFTGTIGLKPTYGRISRYGLIAYASSFDQIGPIGNDVADIALVTEIMAGEDEYDGTASSKEVPALAPNPLKNKLKIAYIKETLDSDGIDTEIKERIEQLINCLRADGHELIPVSFAYVEQMVPTYYVLTTAEASSNLSRFDGVHFGYRSNEAKGVEETYVKSRTEGFGDEVKRRIMAGTFVLSQGYFEAYYAKAQKVRRLIQDRTNEILEQNDVILLPTTPTTAFELNSVKDPIQMYLQDIYTVQANLAGNPAISLPIGKHSNGMPFGLQLIGKHFGEKELLDTSAYLMDFC